MPAYNVRACCATFFSVKYFPQSDFITVHLRDVVFLLRISLLSIILSYMG